VARARRCPHTALASYRARGRCVGCSRNQPASCCCGAPAARRCDKARPTPEEVLGYLARLCWRAVCGQSPVAARALAGIGAREAARERLARRPHPPAPTPYEQAGASAPAKSHHSRTHAPKWPALVLSLVRQPSVPSWPVLMLHTNTTTTWVHMHMLHTFSTSTYTCTNDTRPRPPRILYTKTHE